MPSPPRVAVFAAVGLADDLPGCPPAGGWPCRAAAGLARAGLLATSPAGRAGGRGHGRRGHRGLDHRLRQRLQLHGRRERHLRRARPGRRRLPSRAWACGATTRSWPPAARRSRPARPAFLPWNAVRARVFLGDVGSYALGAALAAAGRLRRRHAAFRPRPRSARWPCTWPTPPGPCSAGSGPASRGCRPTARTPTSGCATRAGRISGCTSGTAAMTAALSLLGAVSLDAHPRPAGRRRPGCARPAVRPTCAPPRCSASPPWPPRPAQPGERDSLTCGS